MDGRPTTRIGGIVGRRRWPIQADRGRSESVQLDVGAREVLFLVPVREAEVAIDAAVPRRWLGDAVYFPESRQAYANMLENGWLDSIRRIHPEKGIYTYWNFSFRGGFDRSSGLRMDHLLISPSLSNRLRDAGVDTEVR